MPGLYLLRLVCLCNKLQHHLAAKNKKLTVLTDSVVGVQVALSAGKTLNWGVTYRVTRRLIPSLIHSFVCCVSWDDWKTRVASWTPYVWPPHIAWVPPSQAAQSS